MSPRAARTVPGASSTTSADAPVTRERPSVAENPRTLSASGT